MNEKNATTFLPGKGIPPENERQRLRSAVAALATDEFSFEDLANRGQALLAHLDLPVSYLGFAMVEINNAVWERQFAAVPFARRLLLLPQCLRHPISCCGKYANGELQCALCGACQLANWTKKARDLGYRVLIAEGTPAVLQMILDEDCDALLGVACLEVMEKTFDHVRRLGVPHLAVPLLRIGCQNTLCDEDRLRFYLSLSQPASVRSSYLSFLREARQMFKPPTLQRLLHGLVEIDADAPLWDEPHSAAERLAVEWLAEGGKRLRPFLTIAAYAVCRGLESPSCGEEIPDSVRRVALALEIMHKASLVHDDIEDEDDCRYGQPTLHRRSNVAAALNAGDLLIGLGYGLIAAAAQGLGARCAIDILERVAAAHLWLCRGQGAEFAWQKKWLTAAQPFTAVDALEIYAAKTAPAFEVCLCAGLRMAGEWNKDAQVRAFARALGIAFQIGNDSEDWSAQNPRGRGRDAWAGRPTLFLACAVEADADAMRALWRRRPPTPDSEEIARWADEVEDIYHKTSAFAQAEALRRKYRHRALALAREMEPQPLADFLAFAARLALGP